MDKPVLLIDVDGVLNPYSMKHNKISKLGFTKQIVTVPADEFHPELNLTVVLNKNLAKELLSLDEYYDLVWCTTWNHHANDILAKLLDFPKLPVLELSPPTGYNSYDELFWKTSQVHDAFSKGLYKGRRFAWLDDDLSRKDRVFFNHTYGDDFHKLMIIFPGLGFTLNDKSTLVEWARDLKNESKND